jgi:hypothetical protein
MLSGLDGRTELQTLPSLVLGTDLFDQRDRHQRTWLSASG